MAFQNFGVIFVNKKQTSKKGAEYFSGKTEGSEEFDLMAFIKESKSGVKYLSVVKVTKDDDYQPKAASTEGTNGGVNPSDLPF